MTAAQRERYNKLCQAGEASASPADVRWLLDIICQQDNALRGESPLGRPSPRGPKGGG